MGLRTPNTDLAGIRGQAETYRLDAAFLGRAQYKAAEYADRRSRYFGAPAAALSAIVGTSIFATIDSQPALHWKILAGLVSLAAALLGSLQAFYRFAERAQEHRAAGAAYASLRRQLDGFLLELAATSTPGEALKKLAVFRRRFDEIGTSTPLIPSRAYEAAVKELSEEAERDPTSLGKLIAENKRVQQRN